MTSNTQKIQKDSQSQKVSDQHPLDPNVLQRKASEPESSVWVSASAGTGKTKVLTDRVLRLLLPRINGQKGSPAHKIMCLTFTKAAANEMSLRISQTLAQWAVMPLNSENNTQSLKSELKKLLGRKATEQEIKAARQLFADVIDVPGGLKIMTIHAFCQSILGRFPLEAAIAPNFTVLEESQAETLMKTATNSLLKTAKNQKSGPLPEALHNIATAINEDQFNALLHNVAREKNQFHRLLSRFFDCEGIYTNICQHLQISPNSSPEDIKTQALQNNAFEAKPLMQAATTMFNVGSSKDQDSGQKIINWISANPEKRLETFSTYQSAFLNKTSGQIKAKLAYSKSINAQPDIPDILAREALRILKINEAVKASTAALLTRDLLHLSKAILDEYKTQKEKQSCLDFDDLIIRTLNLLNGQSMGMDAKTASSWVHFKLDQGLDHILIDEAQDTNPEQWEIIAALCNEFFENTNEQDTPRTVFTVGDEKQSIYSFQRASPQEFSKMHDMFSKKIQNAKQRWDNVPMNISFRSTQSILQAVDAVFSDEKAHQGMGQAPVKHQTFRRGQAGLVELWPLFESDETPDLDLWKPLKQSEETLNGQKKTARHIAKKVKRWLASEEILESKNRPVKAGDIMILVRTRSNLVNQIARELKNQNIPVSGLDRMILSEELGVQDLISAADFALQCHDDLSLACFLKSPLIGLSEEELYILCINREKNSLYQALQNASLENIAQYCDTLRHQAQNSPFSFLSYILQNPCPADNISGQRAIIKRLGKDTLDPIDELLNQAYDFEQKQAMSLQNFVHHHRKQTQEIKREQDGQTDEVRIMTIHGSKGLQAPIVILPDTVTDNKSSATRSENRLLWPAQTGLKIPLWSPRKNTDFPAYDEAMETLRTRQNEEHKRLLYVAMTRAEDRLYITGALNKRQNREKIPENCWYKLVERGMQSLKNTQSLDDGTQQLSNPHLHDIKQNQTPDETEIFDKQQSLPQWIRRKAPQEDAKQPLVRPSQIHDEAVSPLRNADTQKFLRGNLTHKLLQLLPEIQKDKQETTAKAFIKKYGQTLKTQTQCEIVEEVIKIIRNKEFTPFFSPQSIAEAPITGYIEGQGIISGQIDRLYITQDSIWIIDYKTNRPPPTDPEKIPQAYKLQMKTYAQILEGIYPNRTIKAALLWTDGPLLMPLDLKTM